LAFFFFGIMLLTAFFAFLATDFAALTTRFVTDFFTFFAMLLKNSETLCAERPGLGSTAALSINASNCRKTPVLVLRMLNPKTGPTEAVFSS
jgi:hypothetical protein